MSKYNYQVLICFRIFIWESQGLIQLIYDRFIYLKKT